MLQHRVNHGAEPFAVVELNGYREKIYLLTYLLAATLRKLRLDSKFAAVTLQRKSGKGVDAHRLILSARCDFFEDKFAALQKKPPLVISFENMFDEDLELVPSTC